MIKIESLFRRSSLKTIDWLCCLFLDVVFKLWRKPCQYWFLSDFRSYATCTLRDFVQYIPAAFYRVLDNKCNRRKVKPYLHYSRHWSDRTCTYSQISEFDHNVRQQHFSKWWAIHRTQWWQRNVFFCHWLCGRQDKLCHYIQYPSACIAHWKFSAYLRVGKIQYQDGPYTSKHGCFRYLVLHISPPSWDGDLHQRFDSLSTAWMDWTCPL